jgi:hypothetical protein
MSEEPTGGADEAEQGGVFGKLPDSRPGTRSPRRDRGAKAGRKPAPAKAAAATTKRKPAGSPRARPAAKPPRREQPAAEREPVGAERPEGEEGGGLDDLAWAGIAAVAEAATLGVRLANRALGALRDGVDRR